MKIKRGARMPVENYNGIKFYSVYDPSIGFYLKKFERALINFYTKKKYVDVNEIIELYTIKLYLDSGVKFNNW